MAKLVAKSDLSSHEYVPYFLSWAVHLQGLVFAPYNEISESLFTVRYYREIFTLADGEKIALDWFEEPEPKGDSL